MAKNGPIIVLEDDEDDKSIFEEILRDLDIANRMIWFTKADDAFKYLKDTPEQPFIIISDVNVPGQNGLEFKKRIDNDEELRKKSIPFVFFSTSVDQKAVNEAYTKMTVQGFFQKYYNYEEIKACVKLVLDYWKFCKHPNVFD
jgi:response regulator RpfG family c-di-GMP phosphodiesterase